MVRWKLEIRGGFYDLRERAGMKRRIQILSAVLGCGVVAGAVLALALGANAQFTFHHTVRRVVVDVVVTDKKGNPVHGLTRNDFTVYEDNQIQEVRSFDAFSMNDNAFVPPPQPQLPPDTYMNVPAEPERGPLYIIVLDATNTGITDQEFARAQLAKFLQSKPEGTRFELYYLGMDLRLAQGFTTDKQKLLDAFDVKRKDGHVPWVFLYRGNAGGSDPAWVFEVLGYIAKNVEGLPGRKNIIWLSSNMPGPVTDTGGVAQPLAVLAAGLHGTPSSMRELASADMDTIQQEEIVREAVDSLNFAQASVYPIDLQGLTGQASWDGMDTIARQLASSTGGQAYYNRNDVVQEIDDATENGGSYYEMTYAPPAHEFDGKQHTIKVTVTNPSYQLEYRPCYFDDDPDQPMTNAGKRLAAATANEVVAHKPGDSMFAYMAHGAPMAHAILFKAEIHAGRTAMATPAQMADLQEQPAFFVLRRRKKPTKVPPPIPLRPYAIDYLVLDQTAGRPGRQVLEFAACAYDADGKMLNGLSQYAASASGQNVKKDGKPLFRGTQVLEVPTTAQWLRVAVRDVATDKIGSIEVRLPLAGEARESAEGAAGTSGNVRPVE